MTAVPAYRDLTAVVSGSFHRHIEDVQRAVATLKSGGVRVLSPEDPRVVDAFGDFLFVASDKRRTIRGIQNRHLEAISRSDLLWLACPDGYVGPSAAMEVGFAVARSVPVFALRQPNDPTIRGHVARVAGVVVAVQAINAAKRRPGRGLSLLLEPRRALDRLHDELEIVRDTLNAPGSSWNEITQRQALRRIHQLTELPGRTTSRRRCRVECPDGRITPATALRIGFAVGKAVPVETSTPPTDLTLRQYVNADPSPSVGRGSWHRNWKPSDRDAALAVLHDLVDDVERTMPVMDHNENDPIEEILNEARTSISGLAHLTPTP
jgi:hypothetical protein